MRFNTVLRVIATGAAMALVLAGCSPSGGTGGSSNKEVTLWHMENTPNKEKAFQSLADAYNKTNPEYKVNVQVQDWGQVYTKIAAAAQSGKQPDILFAIPDFATYVRSLGLGNPVTDLVKRIETKSPLLTAAKAPYTDHGDMYAVPLYGMVEMLWYRVGMLKAAGVNPPKTWDELLAAAETLTSGTTSGIALAAGKNLATDQMVYNFMITGGAADFFTKDNQVNIDTPEAAAAFDIYDKLLKFSPVDSANFGWAEPQAALNNGSAAMTIEKGQQLSVFEAESGHPSSDLACAPIPLPASGGRPGAIYYSNGAMILSEDKAKAEGAGDFLQWLLESEQYGDVLNAEPGLFLPVTEDQAAASNWRSNPVISKYKTCVDAMLDESKTGELMGFVGGQYVNTIGQISGQNILAQGVQQMYVNGMSPEEAVKWIQQQMQNAIQ